jgi:Flp pilus assembly secretin CpaC
MRSEQNMMIVGQVSTPEEAEEIERIAKSFVIGNRVRNLAQNIKQK